ncbi:hypothetical protein [Chryseobacterium indologenes]|uniref:hypothetical protein n=1 Tax=Chryseobacterium indologenes TaxID=253 RepID=UPI0040597063
MMKSRKKILKQNTAQILFAFFSLSLMINCKKQPPIFEFNIEKVDKNIVDELKTIKLHPAGLLYSDTIYEVWKTCSGEWGGTVYFKNKKSGKIYNATASCPVSVNKINNTYYLSNSMSHLSGNSDILQIADPEKMEQVTEIPIHGRGVSTRAYESQSLKGTKKIVGCFETLLMSSFVYQQKLYSILSHNDSGKVTISELRGNKFYSIQEIDKKFFSDNPLIIKKSETYQKIYFQQPNPGILEINKNKIRFISYTKSKK